MLRMEDTIDKVFLEMAHSRFMLIGLKSVPEQHYPFMIHSALLCFNVIPTLSIFCAESNRCIQAPADPFIVVLPIKLFPLKLLKEDLFVNLAIEHFESKSSSTSPFHLFSLHLPLLSPFMEANNNINVRAGCNAP